MVRLPPETDYDLEPEKCLPKEHNRSREITLLDTPSLEKKLIDLLDHAWQEGFTIQSAYARDYAELVAMASSLQLITTRVNRDVFSRTWQITAKGHRWLNEAKELG